MNYLEQYRQLVCYGLAEHNGKLWFYNFNFCAIVEMDLQDMIPYIIWTADGDDFFKWNQYGDVVWYKNRLVFAPRDAEQILIFDLTTHEVIYIPFDRNKVLNKNTHNLFVRVITFGDIAYFFPGRYRAILKLDLKTYQISYFDKWDEEMGADANLDSVAFANARKVSQHVYMLPGWQQGKLLAFDLKKECSFVYHIGTEALSDILSDGEVYWVSLRNRSSIIRWVPEKKELKLFEKLDMGVVLRDGFMYILKSSKYLYLIPVKGKGIIRIHKETKDSIILDELSVCNVDTMNALNSVETNAFSCTKVSKDQYIIFDAFAGDFILIDTEENAVKRFSARLNENDWRHLKQKVYEKIWKYPRLEDLECGIYELILSINDMIHSFLKKETQKTIGEKIYESSSVSTDKT